MSWTVRPTASTVPNKFRATEALSTTLGSPLSLSAAVNGFPAIKSKENTFQKVSSVSRLSTVIIFPAGTEIRILPPVDTIVTASGTVSALKHSLATVSDIQPFDELSLVSPF